MRHFRTSLQQAWRLLVLSVLATATFAQNTTVSGTVSDPQGNALPNATIVITNKANGISRTVTSADSGAYQIPQVAPGMYKIKAEATGFASIENANVQVLVNTPLTLNLAFTQVGGVSDTVTITGGETTLNTTDATIGNSFNSTKVIELPLNARNIPGLLSLQSGVTPSTGNEDDVQRGGHVNGARSDQSNVTLDGVDVNEQQGGRAFFSVLRLTPDSLQEFRVTTTNANADAGRSSGAQVALVTKSGTDNFHGSLYEYHRNTVTSANDWFNNKSGVERPALIRNNFGGSLGGPIKKGRAFFFFNYEGFREAKGTSIVRTVPLPTLGQGIVRYKSANGASDPTCPAGTPAGTTCQTAAQINAAYLRANGVTPGINNTALAVLASAAQRYRANDTSTGDGLNTSGFRFNASAPVQQDTYIARFDFNLASNHIVFARLNYQNDNATVAATSTNGQRFPDTPAPTLWNHPTGISTGHAWTISNTLVNNFRFGVTRAAFTGGGDSAQTDTTFRFVFEPFNYTRTAARVTPVYNLTDDLSWSKGQHSLQFGTNLRFITNNRLSFATTYDYATTNPSYYDGSGDVLVFDDANGNDIFPNMGDPTLLDLRGALAAVIGRFSEYGANINYDPSGKLLTPGSGIGRIFKTQEYEFYGQDSWRMKPNLTLTYGIRYSTTTPLYEANGVQVKPTTSLSDFFDQRVAGAKAGQPYNALLSVDLAGKANGREGYYPQDWNNFAPSVAVAWSPNFQNGLLKTIFGENKTTVRGGFRMTYDRMGSALAVAFDLNSTLGFTSQRNISANTYNVSTRLAPLFAAIGQNVRALPGITIPGDLRFPLQTPGDEEQRIEQSLDDRLTTPYNYSWNASVGREFGKGYALEVSYVGRVGRNLLLSRDVAHFNNLVDPKSGVDFYTAMRQLIGHRQSNSAITSVQNIAYFENLFPGLAGNYSVLGATTRLTATQAAYRRIARSSVGGRSSTDYTFAQAVWDDGLGAGDNLFIHPQYATFAAYSSLGTSDYHALQTTLRKRFTQSFYADFNYTYSHSIDIASGNESSNAITGGAVFIKNPLDLNVNRSNSDFDVRHMVNANFGYDLPFGRGRAFFSDMPVAADALFGGWKVTGIYRINSGFPIDSGDPLDLSGWATNWNIRSRGIQIRPVKASPTRTGDPNLFSDPKAAYQSYRTPFPGEVGDRNVLRQPGFVQFDLGVMKTFKLPGEAGQVVFRWDTFNLTNTQRFTNIAAIGIAQDPFLGATPSADFGRFTGIQGTPRVMQFALRIEF
jgi:hypothetical protein